MSAIINSNQVYRVGETPVFVAYIAKTDGTPLTHGDVESISVTHSHYRDGIRNGMIITSWFPIETPDGSIEAINVDTSNVLDTPIDVSTVHVTNYTQNFNSLLTHYNFVYIPSGGQYYYPSTGRYRTVFKITLKNGQTDILPFESMVGEVFEKEDTDHDSPTFGQMIYKSIVEMSSEVFNFGENIEFAGVLYAKYREPLLLPELLPDETLNDDHGKLIFPNTKTSFEDTDPESPTFEQHIPVISNILLTVFDVVTAQRIIDRESLGNGIITVTPTTYELDYTFPTTRLPMAGLYRFRFEIEARSDIVGTAVNNILCVFDIDVQII